MRGYVCRVLIADMECGSWRLAVEDDDSSTASIEATLVSSK